MVTFRGAATSTGHVWTSALVQRQLEVTDPQVPIWVLEWRIESTLALLYELLHKMTSLIVSLRTRQG